MRDLRDNYSISEYPDARVSSNIARLTQIDLFNGYIQTISRDNIFNKNRACGRIGGMRSPVTEVTSYVEAFLKLPVVSISGFNFNDVTRFNYNGRRLPPRKL